MSSRGLVQRTLAPLLALVVLVATGVTGVPALARTNLSIAALGGTGYQKVQDTLLQDYQAANPDVKVTIQYLSWDEIQSKLLVSIAGGVVPDIVMLPTRYAPSFIENGVVSPVDYRAFGLTSAADIPKLFMPGMAGALMYKDRFYFVPTELTGLGLYYNRDMLETRGIGEIPSTWEELGTVAGKLTRMGAQGVEQAGLSFLNWGPFTGFWFLSFLRSAGTDWIEDGRPAFSSPKAVQALQVFADLYHKYKAANPNFGIENFNAGKVGFIPGLTVALFDFRNTGLPFDLGVAPYPHLASGRPASIAYAWGYYVTSGSKNQTAAWKLIDFMTSEKHAPTWLSEAKVFIPRGTTWFADLARQDRQLGTLLAGLQSASMELAHPMYDEIMNAINVACQNIIAKGLGVAVAANELDTAITQILKKSNR